MAFDLSCIISLTTLLIPQPGQVPDGNPLCGAGGNF